MTLTQAILAEAKSLGFDLVGVTTPEPPAHYHVFENWLKTSRHAEMAYLNRADSRERRADPKKILAECRSILVLGIRYPPSGLETSGAQFTPEKQIENIPLPSFYGRVASYAWGEDYHLSLPPRLNRLASFIENQAGKPISRRVFTDSGPVLERELAQRAGLGWIGKNTHLIHPQYGSYILLAEILLDVDLDITSPFDHDRCGTCQRCLKACPTGCILPDRTLDASKCISYLTIELKGVIPPVLRPLMNHWIFGCDICQQVCPWNQSTAALPTEGIFPARSNLVYPDLIEALSLDAETFERRFCSSPIQRAKRQGYVRNSTVALGNWLAEIPSHPERYSAIEKLKETLECDPSPLVRAHAAWALGRAGDSQALQAALRFEQDRLVLEEIQFALTLGG